MVYANSGMSNIQKLYYFKSCLKQEAQEIMNLLKLTGENYDVVIQMLKIIMIISA
jgi:hypothetical protein